MQNLQTNHMYHGFLLKKSEVIPDIHGTGHLFEHSKSGARLFYIESQDENKVFSVSFKTPPQDDCGTPHILEHSVLCGSRKYQSKDPFNELAKGSLNTFLNALTYADKTMYPVASCNEEDFHNLMDVYLDAVFYPNIYDKKEIFMQEGWRYQLNEKEDTLEITGVVYNEMKGALSDPESLLTDCIAAGLFEQTTYGFESGGNPAAIPNLTYEDFLAFHKKYYHPSNAYLYLYGNMDLERCLIHLDKEYLDAFQRISELPVIKALENPPKRRLIKDAFPVDEKGNNKGYLAYSVIAGLCTDEERKVALQILSYVLLETNGSPLKIALQESGICEEAEGWFDSSTYDMVFSIIAKNADCEKVELFQEIIRNTLEKVLNEGLDHELLKSSLRRLEFLLKEEDYGTTPKGLIYNMKLMKSWLHGKEPFDCLRQFETLERVKSPAYDWKKLIKEVLLENEKKTILVFAPEAGKSIKEEEQFQERMKEMKKHLSKAALEQLKEDTEKLELFQQTEDTEEMLHQIPQLQRQQIDPLAKETMYTKGRVGETDYLFVPLQSNGIVYFKLHFDTDALPEELLPYAGLLSEILGKLDTKNHSFQGLPTITNSLFGGLSFQNDVYSIDTETYRSFLTVSGKVLQEDFINALIFIYDILTTTQYASLENLKKIVKSAKIKSENYILNHAHLEGIYYSLGQLSTGAKINELTSGLEHFRFLSRIDEQLETTADIVVKNLMETAEKIFCQNRMLVSLGCENGAKKIRLEEMVTTFAALSKGDIETHKYQFPKSETKVAFTYTGGVQYNILTADYQKNGFSYQGGLQVLRTILNLEYIWNKVRVQGGAYGGGCSFQQTGLCFFYSYRDPALLKTYGVYKQLWEDIAGFEATEREMTKYILGTINRFDQPKSNQERLNEAIQNEYRNFGKDFVQKERNEILSTTAEDIRGYSILLKEISVSENLCTIGNEQKVKEEDGFFQKIQPLIP